MEPNGSGGKLAGKVAVVTASSRGIGAAVAERLASDGAAVVVNYSRNPDRAREVVRRIEQKGGKAVAVGADVTTSEGVKKLFDAAEEHFGRVDVLVNNAGGWNFNPIADVSEEEFDRYFALNAKSAFFGLQEAARRTNDGGRIVNISTAATVVAPAEQSVYVGAKAAAEGFARVAAKELGGRGITVNNVLAGATDTEQLASAVPEEAREQMARASVFGRLGTPRDIADVVAFLASEEARWVTGANISASGGLA